jgi:hypothetical protein
MNQELKEALESLGRAIKGEPNQQKIKRDKRKSERESFRQRWIERQRRIDDV